MRCCCEKRSGRWQILKRNHNNDKSQVFSALAASASQMGDSIKAVKFLSQAHQIAENTADDFYKATAFSAIAVSSAKMGDLPKAVAFLNKANEIADKISFYAYKSQACGNH